MTTLHRSIQSTVFPNYNGVFKKKNQNKKPTATRIGCYVHSPTLVAIVLNLVNHSARGVSWVHDIEECSSPASFALYGSVSAMREFWISRFGMLTN